MQRSLYLFLLWAAMGGPATAQESAAVPAAEATRAVEAAATPGGALDASLAAEAPAARKFFAAPALVTDIGQGNNAKLLEVLLKRDGTVEYAADAQAPVEALEGKATLILGVGASTKGLGAAGLDAASELARAKALIRAAKERGIDIIGVHIGGKARRGELSDQFVEIVFRASHTFIAWKGGNEDGFLTQLAEETEVVYVEVEGKREVGAKLIEQFKAPAAEDSAAVDSDSE